MSRDAQSGFSTKLWQAAAGKAPILFGHYQVLGILGQGGMGTVFKAFHLNLKRPVAIKTLRLSLVKHPQAISRFFREMHSIGQMDHPHVIRATDAGERRGIFYLIMEYLSGQDLSHLLTERGRLSMPDACELARQAALGLGYIHQWLVHRDIKPSNLLLTTSGQVKILDLGLAQFSQPDLGDSEGTPEGCAVGTFAYMAPEQAGAGGQVDGRADLYSLGCTLFRLLTGHPPYGPPDYETPARLIYAHAHIPLTEVEGFTAIPPELKPVLLRLTAKDPNDRYPSAAEVAQVLQPFAAGSRLTELLTQTRGDGDTPVQPLPRSLPEELSRLSEAPEEPGASTPTVPHRRGTSFGRWGLVGLAGLLGLLVALPFLSPPLLEWSGNSPEGEKGSTRATAHEGPSREAVLFPPFLPVPVRTLDALKPLEFHDLLRQAEFPPLLIGYRQDDGLSSCTWVPAQQKLLLSPTNLVLVQLAATGKKRASFTLQTRLDQRPWSGSVGLFWGYREEPEARAARRAGVPFAKFQMLHLTYTRKDDALQYYLTRARVQLQHDQEGRIALFSETNFGRHNVVSLAHERQVSIEVRNGQLKSATFGSTELTSLCVRAVNKEFSPAESQGGIGVVTNAANVTIRSPAILPHEDN